MNVPKYIENKMRQALRHFQAGSALMDEVNVWFEGQTEAVNVGDIINAPTILPADKESAE